MKSLWLNTQKNLLDGPGGYVEPPPPPNTLLDNFLFVLLCNLDFLLKKNYLLGQIVKIKKC